MTSGSREVFTGERFRYKWQQRNSQDSQKILGLSAYFSDWIYVSGTFSLGTLFSSLLSCKKAERVAWNIWLSRLCAVLEVLGYPPTTTIRVRKRHYSVETLSPIVWESNSMTVRAPSELNSIPRCSLQDRYFAHICPSYDARDHLLLSVHPSMSVSCRILVIGRARSELR